MMIKMPKIRTYGIARVAVLVTIAACLFVSEPAFADSVIDAAIKPYFVLGGMATALVFLGIGYFISAKAIRNRRMAMAAEQWPTTEAK
jgi:hypothetical protein